MLPDREFAISVIIPVHHGGENFHRCLAGLLEANPPSDEIIVVADGDTDGSWRLAEEFGAKVLLTPVSGGPARARNWGAREALGDILFFIDADVVIPPNALGEIKSIFRDEDDLAAVFGSYDDEPSDRSFLSQYKNLFQHYVHQTSQEEASTFWGACGAIRREIFIEVGCFDESYRHPSVEDIHLGYRLKGKGYRVKLCKTLQVKHLKRWGIISLLKSDFFHRALPWVDLTLREGRFINDLNLKLSNRLSVMLIYCSIAAVLGVGWWFGFVLIAGVLTLSLLLINIRLYSFFWKKRGLSFALKAILWHWFYYLYSGLAFAVGFVCYIFSHRKK